MQPKNPSNPGRRKFLIAATSVVGAGAVVGAAVPFLTSISPSAKAEAAGAPSKADISKLRKGEMMVIEWRGKPIYVVRHTDKSLELLNQNIESYGVFFITTMMNSLTGMTHMVLRNVIYFVRLG